MVIYALLTLAVLQAQAFTYDADDRISGDTVDANGNTQTSGGITYSYDFEDRLLTTSSGVTIVYDGDGIRVSENTTKYLIDDQTPTGYAQVAEELVSGGIRDRRGKAGESGTDGHFSDYWASIDDTEACSHFESCR